MRINNNIPALNTNRLLNINTNDLQKSLERLSSGKRINRASDDAAGLAISQKMNSQIRGLRQASRNALDGVSMIQTAEGALGEVHDMLQRMRELSVQGANGVNDKDDLEAIRNEIIQLTEQIDKISEQTEFNGIKLLNGMKDENDNIINSGKLNVQIGANKEQFLVIDMSESIIPIAEGSTDKGLKIRGPITEIDTSTGKLTEITTSDFDSAIKTYGDAINQVSSMRSKFGAYQNRLEHTIRNIDNTAENLTSSMSQIEDLDMAKEMSEYTKNNILQQAGTSMLSKANQLPQSVLQLLQS